MRTSRFAISFVAWLMASLAVVAEERIWNGAGVNALAANPTNWVGETAPTTNDAIVLDARTNKNMIWDLDIPVQSWTQDGYTGTVTFATVYPGQGAFTNLAILGDCVISNGVWTHLVNPTTVTNVNNELYRLRVTVGGNLSMGSNAVIDVSGRGYAAGKGQGGSAGSSGGSHGGRGGLWMVVSGPCYGSVRMPINLGSGGGSSAGGGAVWLSVGGTFFQDGQVSANGASTTYHTGAGGSIYIVAGAMNGSGVFKANGGIPSLAHGPGGGGRVALVVTNAGADFSSHTGIREAMGRTADSPSASGTVYLEKPGDPPGKGELIVNNGGVTPLREYYTYLGNDAATQEFSRITLTNGAVLALDPARVLVATQTVFSSGGNAGIALRGGELRVPDAFAFTNWFVRVETTDSTFTAAPLTVGTNASLIMDQPYTLDGDLILERGGLLTHTANPGGNTEVHKLDLTVNGSLIVHTGASINVTARGFRAGNGPGIPSAGGGSYGGVGSIDSVSHTYGVCYGSITAPTNLGSGGVGNTPQSGGGAIILKVADELQVHGTILAEGESASYRPGSGGSIFVTAGALYGATNATISARGGSAWAGGGGGRISLAVTNAGADFSGYQGSLTVRGGTGSGAGAAAAGTVYLRRAGQGQAEGVLIVDNEELIVMPAVITSNVTDTTVGDVLLRRKGYLLVATNQSLTVGGVWSNASSFAGQFNSRIIFAGDAASTSTLFGATTFMGLACDSPGKTLRFPAGVTNTIAALGRLIVKGHAATNVLLRSTVPDTHWFLNVNALAEQDIEFADVRDSNAGGGATVIAKNSVGEDQNNVNWTFMAVSPGETIAWTGTSNTLWGVKENWDRGRPPVGTDLILITNGCPHYPVFDASRTVNRLEIQSGGSISLNGYDLTVTNDAVIAGAVTALGAETVTFQSDVDFTGGTFAPALSIVVLAGEVPQTVNLAGLTFHKVRVDNSAGIVSFTGGFTATELRCEAPSGTRSLTFHPAALFSLRDLILLGSVASTNITLRSSSSGNAWNLNVAGYRQVRGVDVRDSNANGGLPIPAMSSTDSGGNANWTFGVGPAQWLGTSGNNFHTPANWNPAVVPDGSTRVLVESANAMTITGTVSILDLTVGGGGVSAAVTVNGNLTVGENVVVLDKGTLAWNRPGVVSNELVVMAGGLLTHTANTTTEVNKIDLSVGGDIHVEVNAVLDVTARGFQAGQGPGGAGSGNTSGGSYGGRGGIYITDYTKPCYGSIVAPTNLGSGGGNAAGGGAILIRAAGAIRHNGRMIADGGKPSSYYAGSGGTISLQGGSMVGVGLIRANGGDFASTTSPGGGGRVALTVTNAGADWAAFTGLVTAYGGRANGSGLPLAGAGTIYRQTAADQPGRGTVTVNNGEATGAFHTDVPPYTNAVPGEVDRSVFRIAGGARLRLLNDFTVGDIWLDTANARLDLGGNTLTVNAREHLLSPGSVLNDGEIIWRGLPPGTLMIVK